MVEYPTLKFSKIAAGIMSTNAIQLQFLLNHSLFSVRFNPSTSTIERSPQGNIRKEEGLREVVAMSVDFDVMSKIENISHKIKKPSVKKWMAFSSLAKNRTWIWSFGNSYTIHCTTRPDGV